MSVQRKGSGGEGAGGRLQRGRAGQELGNREARDPETLALGEVGCAQGSARPQREAPSSWGGAGPLPRDKPGDMRVRRRGAKGCQDQDGASGIRSQVGGGGRAAGRSESGVPLTWDE